MIRSEISTFEARFAEITQIRDSLLDLDSRLSTYMKKTDKEIAELRKACDIETLKLTFCTKSQPDNILKRLADVEKHVNKIDFLQRSVDQCQEDLTNKVDETRFYGLQSRVEVLEGWTGFLQALKDREILDRMDKAEATLKLKLDTEDFHNWRDKIQNEINKLFEMFRDHDTKIIEIFRRLKILEEKPPEVVE